MAVGRAGKRGVGLKGLTHRIITAWALAGGVVILLVVAIQTISVITGAFGNPLPGDFELTELGVAVGVFCFLPYCQLTDANVTADIFTSGLTQRSRAVLILLSALVALVFAAIMAWRTWIGTLDQFEYDYQTAILQIPIGYAFIPIVISLLLLVLASLVTLAESYRDIAHPQQERM
ncbi:TRAP transporter small permease [Pseudorhizobium flavum]|uniref:TRAP transporter small permease protein n=1 Tax=Pseudorhizobium flavum TaxID=1335061 RepID=A0A7X0DD56_9HYPH|nr:TRAP transporter small permease [Pseudorhizobium flavum]MBB6180335.1 TRAP-type C4-dicarboxylate transport system permease small subunit [Pseudorhizobium flavum]CAD6620337.1 TRAP transporter small permease [Pseudorhizobium flavum]